jgi:antitoxin component of MazEF toxin-antitoxin module
MTDVKIVRIGDALAVVLPEETVSALELAEGDTLFASATPDGLVLSIQDDVAASQTDVLRDIARRFDATMRILAK